MKRLCNHGGGECHAARGVHLMRCCCSRECEVIFQLSDVYRLQIAPGYGGNWYAPGHGTNPRHTSPEPAIQVERRHA